MDKEDIHNTNINSTTTVTSVDNNSIVLNKFISKVITELDRIYLGSSINNTPVIDIDNHNINTYNKGLYDAVNKIKEVYLDFTDKRNINNNEYTKKEEVICNDLLEEVIK